MPKNNHSKRNQTPNTQGNTQEQSTVAVENVQESTTVQTINGELEVPYEEYPKDDLEETNEPAIEILPNGSTLELNQDDEEAPDVDELANSSEINGVSKVNDSTKPVPPDKPKTQEELLLEDIERTTKLLEAMKSDRVLVHVFPMLTKVLNDALATLPDEMLQSMPERKDFYLGFTKDNGFKIEMSRPSLKIESKPSTETTKKSKPIIDSLVGMSTDEIQELNSKKLNRDKICGKLQIDKPANPNPEEFLKECQKLAPNMLSFRMEEIPN